MENSHWKRLWTCRKATERMNEWMNEWVNVTEFFWITHTYLGVLTMKMEALSCSETSVSMYQSTCCDFWEVFNLEKCLLVICLFIEKHAKRMGWRCSMQWEVFFRNGILERQTLRMGYAINVCLCQWTVKNWIQLAMNRFQWRVFVRNVSYLAVWLLSSYQTLS
jgi:hypothetical protein